jgi:hypothetical protein
VGPARQLPRAEGRRRGAIAREAGLGRWCWAGSRAGKERKRERVQLGLGCVGRWAGGPLGVLEGRVFYLSLNSLFKSNPTQLNQTNSKIQIK